MSKYVKKIIFSQRNVDIWKGLKEMIMAKCVHQMEEKLDNTDMETGPHECRSGPMCCKSVNKTW